MAHSHARRNGMWVYDDVGADALAGEGHVFLAVRHSYGSLLPVTGCKFVACGGGAHM